MNTLVEKQSQCAPVKRVEENQYLMPAVNIAETKDTYVIEAEMPGVTRDHLEITLEDHTLTLTGHREPAPPPGEAVYVESKPASFRRIFDLEPTIDAGKITAQLEQGLLTLTLPKAERVKPRKIVVTD
ncbi:MAG: Hsp20/alpha crystallin family protein [Verrucomicrobia bacterium]|nr:Hsp20/alpha crystallin family protein [Verrucomicrobiota bacterium]